MTKYRVLTGVAALLLLAGCSTAADGQPAPSATTEAAAPTTSSEAPTEAPTTTEAPTPEASGDDALEAAVRAYSKAFFDGEATTGYEMLSKRCAAETDLSTYTGTLMAVKLIYPEETPKLETVQVETDGNVGTATYTYSDDAVNVSGQRWVLEKGSWKHDGC